MEEEVVCWVEGGVTKEQIQTGAANDPILLTVSQHVEKG